MTLAEAKIGLPVTVTHIGGDRSFRRRLMELGFLPGTLVELLRVAPLGDPLVFRVRGCNLSIRRREAGCVAVVTRASEVSAARDAPPSLSDAVSAVRSSSS